jgi:hypothetical protein
MPEPPKFCKLGNTIDNCTICGCPEGMTCNDTVVRNRTVGTCYPTPCDSDSQCAAGKYCDSDEKVCKDGKRLGDMCTRDGQCLSGLCPVRNCVECVSDSDCPTEKRCEDDYCVAIPCPEGAARGHACVPFECDLDSECLSTQICSGHVCIDLGCPEHQGPHEHRCVDKVPVYVPIAVIGLIAVIFAAIYLKTRHKEEEEEEKKTSWKPMAPSPGIGE